MADASLASTPLLQGWSARATGGLGSTTRIWSLSAQARVPF
ncbi:MAG: hypothetical protein NT113_25510 [Hyphomicrobiales bacterium]|nr:hypothetical protein [Hyphomicrobiales bacterium]